MIGIYLITSPTGKQYIGQSINIKRRLARYKNLDCKNQQAVYRSLLKYGYENHTITILWSSEDKTNAKFILNQLERDFINLYDTLAPNGMNLNTGGNSFIASEETKLKLSKSRKDKKPMLGKKHSEDTKLKMSIERKGKDNHQSKPVIQLDIQGIKIKEFPSATIAGKELGIHMSGIGKACSGIYKQAGGFIWQYAA